MSITLLLAFDFCPAWSFGFFTPPQRPMTSDFEGNEHNITHVNGKGVWLQALLTK